MLLEINDLNTYYDESRVLQDMSLKVDHGEIVALLGRNGMGKSTTLKSIMGLVTPRSGKVIYKGKDITGFPPYKVAKTGIGYVPEERWIFPTLTVMENLVMGIKGGKIDKNNPNAWTVEKIFKHFPSLEQRQKSKGANLSGGEQQMLAVGRSLMGNPDLILVDEPTEGLAPLLKREVRDMLESISKTGVSILLVEHNLKVAMSLANRVYVMKKACVAFAGKVEELAAHDEIRKKHLEI
ncbi:MAG: ABC transporter ATP-binding protein [Chloroflexi bacterium HGW-Chloroflexi-5]|jgi:branched-chain amino acid transport system ATP-binding protein|nr:MAG: ABC transporter ATP-binding protein [Deltaproteobacteria bacterium HGW-Deltaproteobacteria-12]PKN95976.1 MAG: ABC transporter ATP-binding protein [Chloroflexi bacterium HGW-Chloroflexi-5]